MHVEFETNGDGKRHHPGRLETYVKSFEDNGAINDVQTVWFSVPTDFHTHGDSLAAALMTLVGRRYSTVEFNFPISRYCAETLSWYYALTSVGPIDPDIEPRRPGKHLALNFSGGLDSTALWVLLHDLAGVEFKVITTEYVKSELDRPGYSSYHRDVTCATNARRIFSRDGRFNFATPLLFADYLDLWGVTSGHTFEHHPFSFESLQSGEEPAFLRQDATLNAGGLHEVHITRGLMEIGMLAVLVNSAPQRIEAALNASDFAGRHKRAVKSLAMRYMFEQNGVDTPACLAQIRLSTPTTGRRATDGLHFRNLWLAKALGIEFTARLEPNVLLTDLKFLDDLSLDFFARLNTNYIALIPPSIRAEILRGLERTGIEPYGERDFEELEIIRTFVASKGNAIVSPAFQTLPLRPPTTRLPTVEPMVKQPNAPTVSAI